MSELPEVEAARRAIADHCLGKKIMRSVVADYYKVIDGVSPSDFQASLQGKTIVAAHRKGKNMWLQLDSPPFPSFQFGMAGAIYIKFAVKETNEWPSKYSKLFIELDDGLEISFTDKRRFAKVRLLENVITSSFYPRYLSLALLLPMTTDELFKSLSKKKIVIKALLLDQGFLVDSYGLTWALQNPGRISNLAILNSPVTASFSLPGLFQQLRIPLFGEFTCQNAIIAERFIEAGSTYVLKLEKADVYRLPYLRSSGPGFALLEATRKANFKDTSSWIAAGFSSGRWDVPVLVAWGIADKYLPQSIAEEFQKGNPTVVKLKLIAGASHMPQEDWPEKVVDALRVFL